MKGVILAGGNGTRLRPLTQVTNKHLLPIYDKPMVIYPIETLKALGVKDILLVSGGEHIGKFTEFLGDGSHFGVNLTYRVQEKAGGIAEALGLAEDFVGDHSVTVILGDNIFDNEKLIDDVQQRNLFLPEDGHACVYLKKVTDPKRFGVPVFCGEGHITKIEEKPDAPKSDFAVTGLYTYPSEVFEVIHTLKPSARGELEVTDLNNYFIEKQRMDFIELDGFWSDAGTFESLLKSSVWAAGRDVLDK